MGSRENLPSFFKIVPAEEFTNKLKIPAEFVQHFHGNVPSQCRLQTASQTCLVQVEEVNNKFYFQTGLNDFLLKNRLKDGQLLKFHYAGNSHFHVDIFGKDTCGDFFVGNDIEEPKEEDDGEDDDVSLEILDDSPMLSTLPRMKYKASSSGETSMKKKEAHWSKSEMKKNHKNDDDDDDDDDEEEEEEEEDVEDTEDEIEEEENDDNEETEDEMAEEEDDDFSESLNYVSPQSRAVASRLQKRRSRKISSDGGLSIDEKRLSSLALEKANGFKSDHPSFVVSLCSSYARGKYLNIPRTFSEKHVAKHRPDCFTLWIQRTKKKFSVKVNYIRKITRLQVGWSRFARVNKLRMGDVCVFVLTDAKRFVFDVEVIRLTDVGTSSQGKGKQLMTDSTQVIQID